MNVFIWQDADQYRWCLTEDKQASVYHHGDAAALQAFYQANKEIKNWVLVASALDVAARRIQFSDKERRLIGKAIPFLLEDELLTDADDLHFISGNKKKNSIDIVAIEQQLLAQQLEQLQQAGIHASHCVSEYQLLPRNEEAWQLFFLQQHFVVFSHDNPPLAFIPEHLSLGLESLTANYAELPATIELFADSEANIEQAQQAVPSALQHLLAPQLMDYGQAFQQQWTKKASFWNLLQGQFAKSSEWLSLLKPWRWLAVTAVIAVLLHTVLLLADLQQEKQRHEQLREEMDSVFRQAFPQGQIVDHRRQLERLLTGLRGSRSDTEFIRYLDNVGDVLARHKVDVLNSLNYEQDKNELRLDMLLDSYDQLQAIINDLRELNLDVEIQNSNAQGEQLRARVRVSG